MHDDPKLADELLSRRLAANLRSERRFVLAMMAQFGLTPRARCYIAPQPPVNEVNPCGD